MEADFKNLMDSLTGITKGLENLVTDSVNKMTPQEAIDFAKAMQGQDVQGKMKQATDEINELKKSFKL